MKVSDLDISKVSEENKEILSNLINISNTKNAPVRKIKICSRNDKCPCGSGKKYKNCCMDVDNALIKKYDERRKIQGI